MITLITGLPGNGKTLYALTWLRERALKENRPVYYSGIKDVMIPGWTEADPEKWAELPKGSIIVIDEAQRVFRPRMHGTKVPDFVAALETHRHLGVDLVLITQHPMLADSNVRRLVGQHFHVVRKFGTHWATVHEWMACKETCDKNREDSIKHEFKYPKEVFALYKSAEVHTHKARIPMKVWLLLILPVVLGGLIYVAYQRLKPGGSVATGAGALAVDSSASAGSSSRRGAGPMTVDEYLAQHVPRVPGLAYTAAVYDQVTAPVEAPYPAACVQSASRCTCYTQQATVLELPGALCEAIVKKGFYVAWKAPAGSGAGGTSVKPSESPSGRSSPSLKPY